MLFVSSCSEVNRKPTSVRLTTFKGTPPEIKDCSCHFSVSEKDFIKDRFLFVSNLDSIAFVSINNKLVKLRLVQTTRNKDAIEVRDYENTYTIGVYKLVVSIQFKEQSGDEEWWNTGTLKLFFKDVAIETLNFVGECGC
ncbi:MAG TPA: hypothetical protein PL009_12090 [Flavipsychrobacter sp.]|nr:hypothetical protein [Flavipsychrobacter sp.]